MDGTGSRDTVPKGELICLYAQFLLNMDVFWQAHMPAGPKLIVPTIPAPPIRFTCGRFSLSR